MVCGLYLGREDMRVREKKFLGGGGFTGVSRLVKKHLNTHFRGVDDLA